MVRGGGLGKVHGEAGYGRWELADLLGEKERPRRAGRSLGAGVRGRGPLLWGWLEAAAALICEPESFLNSSHAPCLPLCLPPTSHHLFSVLQIMEFRSKQLWGKRWWVKDLCSPDRKSQRKHPHLDKKKKEMKNLFLLILSATEPRKSLGCRGTPSNLFIGYKILIIKLTLL